MFFSGIPPKFAIVLKTMCEKKYYQEGSLENIMHQSKSLKARFNVQINYS